MPIAIWPRIREGNSVRRTQQHHGIPENRRLGISTRPKWRVRPDQKFAVIATNFSNAYDFETGARVGVKHGAHEDDRPVCAVKQRSATVSAHWNKFSRGHISDKSRNPKRNIIAPLDARDTAIPIGHPLRRHNSQCGENQSHHRGCDQSLKQRKAFSRPAMIEASRRHLALLGCSLIVAICISPARGEETVNTTTLACHRASGWSAKPVVANGETSMRHLWSPVSPTKVPSAI